MSDPLTSGSFLDLMNAFSDATSNTLFTAQGDAASGKFEVKGANNLPQIVCDLANGQICVAVYTHSMTSPAYVRHYTATDEGLQMLNTSDPMQASEVVSQAMEPFNGAIA